MARRRDAAILGGFDLAEAAGVFVVTDGTCAFFTGDPHWPDPDLAAAMWERCRVAAWRHEFRWSVWPPRGAKWDGLPCRSGDLGGPNRERLAADLATLETHKAERPDLAELLAPEYAEYEEASHLLLGLAIKHNDRWRPKLVHRDDGTLDMVGPDLVDAVIDIETRPGHRGKAA